MNLENVPQKVLVIVGPTGVGKTALSISLAETLQGEIVSADSRQIYRWMDIGTDKPSPALQKRIPHYLIDVADPDEYFSAGKYARMAWNAIEGILGKGKQPIVIGGAGLYLRALLDGLFPEEVKNLTVKSRLQNEASEQGTEVLYGRLKSVDPEMAVRLMPGDTQRIIRALEVHEVTGQSLLNHWGNKNENLSIPFVCVGLIRKRSDLYQRIEQRVDEMIARGLVSEVEELRARGYHRHLNSQLSVGYREVHAYLDNEVDFTIMLQLIKQKTRNYAKRQMTWFRKDQRIQWFELTPDESDAAVQNNIIKLIKE